MLGIPPRRFLELRKRVQLGSLAVFGNCLAANSDLTCATTCYCAISPLNRHPFHDALFEGLLNDASLTVTYNASSGLGA